MCPLRASLRCGGGARGCPEARVSGGTQGPGWPPSVVSGMEGRLEEGVEGAQEANGPGANPAPPSSPRPRVETLADRCAAGMGDWCLDQGELPLPRFHPWLHVSQAWACRPPSGCLPAGSHGHAGRLSAVGRDGRAWCSRRQPRRPHQVAGIFGRAVSARPFRPLITLQSPRCRGRTESPLAGHTPSFGPVHAM